MRMPILITALVAVLAVTTQSPARTNRVQDPVAGASAAASASSAAAPAAAAPAAATAAPSANPAAGSDTAAGQAATAPVGGLEGVTSPSGLTESGGVPTSTAPSGERGGDFGYDYFGGNGVAVVDGPIDDDYLLSPRDEVVVTIWGDLNETLNLVVGDQGFIELPDNGGRIQANGVRLRELRPLLLRALSQIRGGYINAADESKSTAFVDIRLGKIRPLLVHVVGEVNRQGAYSVSAAVANVINLLNNAGGVRPTGSLRDVRIKRTDGRIDSVDLYGFFLRGDLDPRTIRLQPGDYIIVPLKQRSATVKGQVRRPMTYELLPKEGLKELIELAGGFLPNAYLKQVQLRRTQVNTGETYMDLDVESIFTSPDADMDLMDRDVVTVGENVQVRKNIVTVTGEGVLRPGTYEWTTGMRLSDAIAKAKGLREYAFLERADLIRTDDDFTKRLVSFPLGGLYAKQADGSFAFTDDPALNLPLREMDEVVIQSTWGLAGKDKSVRLDGMVKEPGTVALAQGMTLQDVIFMRGGFQDPDFAKLAFLDMGHVIRKVPQGTGTRLIAFDLGAVLRDAEGADLALEDGDVIRVYSAQEQGSVSTVDLGGLVKKPGRYTFSESLTLEDLVVLAGGLSPEATRTEAVIARSRRVETGGDATVESITVVELDPAFAKTDGPKHALLPFDQVNIRHKPGWEPTPVASVTGQVMRPGGIPMPTRDLRLSDLINRAGGLRPEAYPEGATLMRRSTTMAGLPDGTTARGEVTIDLASALRKPGSAEDLIVQDGDQLFVPQSSGMVTVAGGVARPMVVQHRPGIKLSTYLDLCGGLLARADRDRVTVTAPNNATTLVGKGQDPVLLAGSTIRVPLQRETERLQVIEVKGAVQRPALVQFVEDATLGYYLGLCGGFTANADVDRVVVLLPDGELLSKEGDREFNPQLPAGAIVVVTARPTTQEGK
jgi:protein involved in polysaccharide export with SLBB domain